MQILLFGCDGQLGRELQVSLASLGKVIAVDRKDLDLQEVSLIPAFINQTHPNVIVNAAAYTDVDQAEIESEVAYTINARACGVMAESARKMQSLVIHYSTDFVFDGEKGTPYTEDDPANPINVYGQTKLAGEQSIDAVGGAYLIFRTSWLYGSGQNTFPIKVLAWARKQEKMRIVEDQIGSPTWSRTLARTTTALLNLKGQESIDWLMERSGLYHVAGKGAVSRFEWAKRILELDPQPEEHVVKELQPAQTAEFQSPAKRPRFSALDCHRFESTFEIELPRWASSLETAIAEGF
jgi:dTDP-4-dehydrorhamnose reductase